MSTLPEQSGVKQAYSLAYAAFRLGAILDNAAFRQSLEKRGLELLSAALDGDAARQVKLVRDLEYLVGFGRDVGSIHPQTAELILGEISKFNPAVSDKDLTSSFTGTGSPVQVPFEDLFPARAPKTFSASLPNRRSAVPAAVAFAQKAPVDISHVSSKLPDVLSQSFSSRKDKIVERIRQSGNSLNPAIGCRLRDIQEVLPDLSERTLRYDLQRLVAEGVIERIGNGGPATFYKIRQ